METLHTKLHQTVKVFIDAQVAAKGYVSASEYLAELVQAEQVRAAREHLNGLLLDGLQSGDPSPMTPQDWEEIRREIHERHALRNRS